MQVFETIFSDGLACRLTVFLTKGETPQNGSCTVRLHEGRRYQNKLSGEHILTTNCLGQSLSFCDSL
jgi:hypothetical protein